MREGSRTSFTSELTDTNITFSIAQGILAKAPERPGGRGPVQVNHRRIILARLVVDLPERQTRITISRSGAVFVDIDEEDRALSLEPHP